MHCGRAVWQTRRLGVRIRPDFACEAAIGDRFAVKLWLKDRALGTDARWAMLLLLESHMDEICPGVKSLVIDVRRDKVYPRTRREPKGGFDIWVEAEAGTLAELWGKFAA